MANRVRHFSGTLLYEIYATADLATKIIFILVRECLLQSLAGDMRVKRNFASHLMR